MCLYESNYSYEIYELLTYTIDASLHMQDGIVFSLIETKNKNDDSPYRIISTPNLY